MNTRDPKITALQFNQCIADHDLEGLARLMTGDHAFVESDGTVHQPKREMVEKWRQFFEAFPEYRNTFDRVQSKANLVVMLGSAFWSEEQPYDPAIWTATVVDDLVHEWRIYTDTLENRAQLGLI
jgi:predicted SnoaL-like aldol condensation-catalyzing enzyme